MLNQQLSARINVHLAKQHFLVLLHMSLDVHLHQHLFLTVPIKLRAHAAA